MATYRVSRNIEASFIDFITDSVAIDWVGVNVCKTFSRVYKLELPVVCIRLSDTIHTSAELGSNATVRTPLILIDIFGTSAGNALDLKDYLVKKLKSGIKYFEYTIALGKVTSKVQRGRIRVLRISDTPVNFDIDDKAALDFRDRYRHLLSINASIGRMEV